MLDPVDLERRDPGVRVPGRERAREFGAAAAELDDARRGEGNELGEDVDVAGRTAAIGTGDLHGGNSTEVAGGADAGAGIPDCACRRRRRQLN